MKADVKVRWLEALRSGRYAQGQSVLRTADDRFCCLGVLLDVMGEKPTDERVSFTGDFVYDGGAYAMSTRAVEEVGLTVREHGQLASMNDEGCSFAEIADYIEATVSSETNAGPDHG